MDDPNKQAEDFDFDLRLKFRGKRRKAILPWLVVAGLALISSANFWKVVEKFWTGVG